MKTILFTLFFAVLLTSQSYCQELQFGAKAGLNLSTITEDQPEGTNPRLAYHFGGFAQIPITQTISLNPELLYFSIGYTFNYASGVNSYKLAQRANFITIPLNLRYHFTDRFGVDFGPQIGFLLHTQQKIKESSTNLNSINQRVSGKLKTEYGANLGFTFTPSPKTNIQLRYYQGLTNLLNTGNNAVDQSFNVALQLSVGYVIF